MEIFKRQCPKCGRDIEHKNQPSLDRAKKRNGYCSPCAAKERVNKYGLNEIFIKNSTKGVFAGANNPFYGKTHSNATIEKIKKNINHAFKQTKAYKNKVSKQTSGKGNPMYGRTYYQIWLEKYGKEKADELQKAKNEKTKIQCSGKGNPMYGKPTPQGSGNGWKGWYKGWFFRSLKELSYVVNVLEPNGDLWESAEHIKIPYINWQGVQRTYRPDFLVNRNLLVETKPTRLKSSITVRAKQKAAEEWCKLKGWSYLLVDPPIITSTQIKNLHNIGLLKFTDRYEQLWTTF